MLDYPLDSTIPQAKEVEERLKFVERFNRQQPGYEARMTAAGEVVITDNSRQTPKAIGVYRIYNDNSATMFIRRRTDSPVVTSIRRGLSDNVHFCTDSGIDMLYSNALVKEKDHDSKKAGNH